MAEKRYLDSAGLAIYDGKIKDFAENTAESEASSAVSTHDSNVNAHSGLLANYVPATRKIAGLALSSDIAKADLTAALDEATTALKGLLSPTDKQRINNLWAIFDNGADEDFVDTLTEVLEVFASYPEGVELIERLADKVDKNEAITPGTKTKISYDSKGLVTSGADATLDDIVDGTTKKWVNIVDRASAQSISGTKTFDSEKLVVKGSGTGVTTIKSDNATANSYVLTLQAKTGTVALLTDLQALEFDTITEAEINALFA
jgi:rhamnose utilization protein RhaD (predicted bifunctional aldolase and dehydrogenase)